MLELLHIITEFKSFLGNSKSVQSPPDFIDIESRTMEKYLLYIFETEEIFCEIRHNKFLHSAHALVQEI